MRCRMPKPAPGIGEGSRASTTEQARLPPPSTSGTLSDTMRSTPRGDMGWQLCPPKLDCQPFLFVYTCLEAREATAFHHKRNYKKYVLSPLTWQWLRSNSTFKMLFY